MSCVEPVGTAVGIGFDFVCPWCLIGLRHWRAALHEFAALHPQRSVRVVWRPAQLLPGIPAEGLPYQAFYEARLGGRAAVAARRAQVQQAGDAVGLRFAFDRIERMPNTLRAHALAQRAATHAGTALHGGFVERVLEAFFLEGRDIGQAATLVELWQQAGLPAWSEGEDRALAEPRPLLADAVRSVPSFAFGPGVEIHGAQPARVLLRALQVAQR